MVNENKVIRISDLVDGKYYIIRMRYDKNEQFYIARCSTKEALPEFFVSGIPLIRWDNRCIEAIFNLPFFTFS